MEFLSREIVRFQDSDGGGHLCVLVSLPSVGDGDPCRVRFDLMRQRKISFDGITRKQGSEARKDFI
jgi:hypothetical protein